jgi:hypothetical protein
MSIMHYIWIIIDLTGVKVSLNFINFNDGDISKG